MSLDREHNEEPLSSVKSLEDYFRRAERPVMEHLVGLEHEKLIYRHGSAQAVPYEGPDGIEALLKGLAPHGYTLFKEQDDAPIIALTRGIETISLEPGGQFELSGSPHKTARLAHEENERHLTEVRDAGRPLGLYPLALGYRPFDHIPEMPWMPKTRYRMMREVLPTRGGMALDMMLMTATGQVSLDWSSEADCARKVTLTARVTPLLVALYANSPLVQGKPSGFQSYRSHVWSDVDRTRCGYFPAMLDGTFRYRAYVEWALDAPLLFLRRNNEYLRPKMTFRRLMKEGFEGKPANKGDWVDHLSTLFPEVRIKKVLEVRGADCASVALTGALPALFRGLLYDTTALDDAERILPRLGYDEHLSFHEAAQRDGLKATLRGKTIAPYALQLVEVARRGLMRLEDGDESLLDALEAQARSGASPAEDVLRAFEENPDPAALLEKFAL